MDAYIQFNNIFEKQRKNPLVPIWGELFSVVWNIKKEGKQSKKEIILYVSDIEKLYFDPLEDRFIYSTSDMRLKMKEHEYVDALVNKRFLFS